MMFAKYPSAPECDVCKRKHAPTNRYHRAIRDLNGKFLYTTISEDHYNRHLRESTELRNRMSPTLTLLDCIKSYSHELWKKYARS